MVGWIEIKQSWVLAPPWSFGNSKLNGRRMTSKRASRRRRTNARAGRRRRACTRCAKSGGRSHIMIRERARRCRSDVAVDIGADVRRTVVPSYGRSVENFPPESRGHVQRVAALSDRPIASYFVSDFRRAACAESTPRARSPARLGRPVRRGAARERSRRHVDSRLHAYILNRVNRGGNLAFHILEESSLHTRALRRRASQTPRYTGILPRIARSFAPAARGVCQRDWPAFPALRRRITPPYGVSCLDRLRYLFVSCIFIVWVTLRM